MAVTYRILFYIFLANSFESKAYVEVGLQKNLANLNQDDFDSAAIEVSECQKVFDNVPKDEQVVIEADYKAGWDSATGQSVFYISLL